MSVEVRRATVADRTAIDRFIVATYGPLAPFKGPDRWTWQFERNPYLGVGEDNLAPVWIAMDGAEVVGQIAVQGAEFKLGERMAPAGWIVDVMIAETHRGLGLGHKLYEAAMADVDLLVTLTMAPATRRMADRLGAVNVSPTRHYTRWEKIGPGDVRRYLVQRTEHRPDATKLVRIGCGLGAHHPIAWGIGFASLFRRRPARGSSVEITEVSTFGPEIDGLWDEASADYAVLGRRDSRFLNWRFVDAPGLAYRRFIARRAGKVVGYSVLRRTEAEELRQGVIVDLFARRSDAGAYADLVAHALEHFAGQVASVECGTSVPEIEAVLKAAGFFSVKTHYPTVVVRDPTLRAELATKSEGWLMSKADHDWDQVHLG